MVTAMIRAVPYRSTSLLEKIDDAVTIRPTGSRASASSSGDQPRVSCRYRVTMNCQLKYEPPIAMIARLALTRVALRRMPRRISGCATRFSTITNAATSAATPMNEPIVRAEAQPTSCAVTTV